MNTSMQQRSCSKLKTARAATVALLSLAAASVASASGSMSFGDTNGRDAYAAGKSIFFKQVVCASCPYAGRGKDTTDAKALRDTLNSTDSKVKLDNDDKGAVNTYLTERFKLAMADKK